MIQILVFGAAHANYPAQPAHARLVELILPSAAFGLLYLRFGLLPAIGGVVLAFSVLGIANSLPVYLNGLSMAQQVSLQIEMQVALFLVGAGVLSGCLGLIAGHVHGLASGPGGA